MRSVLLIVNCSKHCTVLQHLYIHYIYHKIIFLFNIIIIFHNSNQKTYCFLTTFNHQKILLLGIKRLSLKTVPYVFQNKKQYEFYFPYCFN